MTYSGYCYFNGELLRYEDATLHISDLAFQRGYGVFDFFRSREGSIPWFEDYIERLFKSMNLAGIEADMDRETFRSIIRTLQERNNLENGAFKVIVTGGYSDNLESVSGPANVLIMNIPWIRPSRETYEKGVNLISENFVRPNPEIKTLYYLNTLRLQKKLKEYHAVDVAFHTDSISEASRANLFFVKKGKIQTPSSNILNGITRKQVLALSPDISIADIPAKSLFDFDEMFMTSTSRDITPVVQVDGKAIGKGIPGPVTRDLQAIFKSKAW